MRTDEMAPLKNIIKADVVWEVFKNLLLITVGSVLCAAATNGIIIPQKFISAGFTGLALSIFYFLPSLSVGWLYFILNIPLFVLGWRFVGRRFLLYSIIGMLVFSAALYFVRVPFSIQDKLLSALLAGIISGAGSGIILRSAGSAGGLDILAVIMARSFSLRLGSTSLAFNSILLFTAGLMFSLESALYTLIYIFVTSYMVNLVVTGLSQRKSVFIISSRWKEIAEGIREEIQRGYTLISGRGGYTGQDEQILYTVITFRELHRLKTLIRQVDPNAFMVVHDTLEVMGHRIGNQPHW
ncbi:MAG: YitT family protein [Desulfatiglandales bacterium]